MFWKKWLPKNRMKKYYIRFDRRIGYYLTKPKTDPKNVIMEKSLRNNFQDYCSKDILFVDTAVDRWSPAGVVCIKTTRAGVDKFIHDIIHTKAPIGHSFGIQRAELSKDKTMTFTRRR